MKKILSILLAVMMLLSMASFTVFAAETPAFQRNFDGNGEMSIAGEYEVKANTSALIAEGQTLYLDPGAVLNVYGELIVDGMIVSRGGDLIVKYDTANKKPGVLLHSENVYNSSPVLTTEEWYSMNPEGTHSAHCFAEIFFPSRTDPVYSGLVTNDEHIFSPRYMWSATGSSYEDVYEKGDGDPAHPAVNKFNTETPSEPTIVRNVYSSINGSAAVIAVPLNQYLFAQSYITDATGAKSKKYDSTVISMYLENVAMDHYGAMNRAKITTAGAVSYKMRKVINTTGAVRIDYVKWDNDDDFLSTFRIYLPTGTGYSVFGRLDDSSAGVISADGQTVRLKYGRPFEFRLQIDEKYSQSDYHVYLIKTYAWNDDVYTDASFAEMAAAQKDLEPEMRFVWDFDDLPSDGVPGLSVDAHGYYHIDSVTDEYTVFVTGVAENETIEFAGGLMETLRNIFDAFKRFFEMILNFFKIG